MLQIPYYIPPNLTASMVPSYLQRMGYSPGMEQELLLMSEMYCQFNQPGGSTSYNTLSAMYNSSASAAANPLYNSTIPPSTTASPSSYSNIASNVFNGISQLTSSSSAVAAAQYNLSRSMPSYSGSTSALGQSFPFNLYSSSANASTTNSVQALSTTQPGPNAIKNPLLSNLLPPSSGYTKDFSIPTSVITKVSKDVQRSNTPIGPTSISSSNAISNSSHQKSTAHSSHSGSSLSTSNGNPLMSRASPQLSTRASPLSSARGSPSIAARSPSVKANIPSTRTSPSE